MREGGNGSGGREGGLRKGTSEERTELGMDGNGKRGGRKRAEEGGCNGTRERYREERGREGGKLKGMYPDDDTGQYTIYCTLLKTTHNVALVLENLVLGMQNSEQV